MLNISEINDFNQLLKLKNEWNAVAKISNNNNIFLTWEWCSTYWKHLGKGKKLIVLKIEDDECIAFAPLRESKYKLLNWIEYNVIEPMCYGPTDYNGFLMTKRNEECLKLFFKYLYGCDDWDFMHLMDIPETSPILDHLSLIREYDPSLEKSHICPILSISESTITQLNGKFRKNIRRQMRNLKKDYDNVEIKSYDKFSTVDEAMDVFFELHERRGISKKMPSIFSNDDILNFHLDVARIFAEKGWLMLYFLVVDKKPIAAWYGFTFRKKMYLYLTGFNEDFSKYGPGNLLLYELIKICINNGIKKLDFMRGAEQYKSRWSSYDNINYNIKFVNKKLDSKLFDWIKKFRSRL
jgi:CelD/BcsL family acetyltransferase involved in cellulose biosynthesis